jgi:hypothetical protein
MRLHNQREYEVTREKPSDLERWYAEAQVRETESTIVEELTLRSLGQLIKQLKEEIMWYESRTRVREPSGAAVAPNPNPGETSTPCTN